MLEEKLKTGILGDAEKMNFNELEMYVRNLLSNSETQKETNEEIRGEDEINKLIILLESKIFDGLITKDQKSVKNLKEELFRIENKQKIIEEISANLLTLYELRNELLTTKSNQDFLQKAYFQMCKLPSEYFDAFEYHKPTFSNIKTSSRIYRLNISGSEYSDSRKDFSKELPFIIDQAIEKLELSLEKQKKLQEKTLQNDYENRAKKLFSRMVDQKSNGELTKRQHQIVALRSKKKKFFAKSFENIPVKKLPWKFFPKGQWTVEQIVKEFGKYVSQNEVIDESRIWKIYDNLKPSDCYISQDGFNRYIAFCFDWTEKVVLECPIYGNAIYIIKDDWQEITKLHKWQARRSHKVVVIHHSESWFSRLKTNLKSLY